MKTLTLQSLSKEELHNLDLAKVNAMKVQANSLPEGKAKDLVAQWVANREYNMAHPNNPILICKGVVLI